MADQDVLVRHRLRRPHLEEVVRVIKEIDVRPQQILVEATILRATLKENNAMGIDFQVLGGVDFSTLTGAARNFASASGQRVHHLQHRARWASSRAATPPPAPASPPPCPPAACRWAYAKNNIALFLRALESCHRHRRHRQPQGAGAPTSRRAIVFVGNDIGYRTTVTNENNTTSEQVEFLKTGTRLVFRPFIGNDGFIRMEIKPEDSSGNLQNGLPFKFTTEVTTNILVKDGHTIVIGGLFREDSVNTARGQVPGPGQRAARRHALPQSARRHTVREESSCCSRRTS